MTNISRITRQATSKTSKIKPKKPSLKKIIAVGAGTAGAMISQNTGASVALHEVVGHGLLGSRLTHDFNSGDGPKYWIAGFDSLHKMQHTRKADKGLQAFFSWLFLGKSGTIGTASHGSGQPNELGLALGENGTSAWISIAGSIPGLIVNTLFVSVGMSIRKKYPNLAIALVLFGLESSVVESTYAWSAATMSNSELQANAQTGHDFANFAVRMSSITGLSPSLIAISTALFWTGFIPLVALGIYFYQESQAIDIVPPHLAVFYFANEQVKTETEADLLLKLMQEYSDTNHITEELKETLLKDSVFYVYLYENIPEDLLKKSKMELIDSWQRLQKPSKLQTALCYAMGIEIALGVIVQMLNVLATTIEPCLIPAVDILNFIIPILGIISVIGAGHETFNDLMCNNQQIPVVAKTLSVLKLITAIAIMSLVATATFASGMGIILIPTVLIGTMLNLSLSFAKTKIIQDSFMQSFRFKEPLQKAVEDKGLTNDNPDLDTPAGNLNPSML